MRRSESSGVPQTSPVGDSGYHTDCCTLISILTFSLRTHKPVQHSFLEILQHLGLLCRLKLCPTPVNALQREIEVLKVRVLSTILSDGFWCKTPQELCFSYGQSKLVTGNHTSNCHNLLMWCVSGVPCLDSSSG
ncbi:unnamed protein product [Pylaiella littoralis]